MSEASGHLPGRDGRHSPGSGRFVPSGVDAQSWLGFEHRIQERRYRGLLEAIAAASARGDGIAARIALEEARELRPDAPELDEVAGRVALLPAGIPTVSASGHIWSRTVGAVALLVVGVALLTALDVARSNGPAAPEPVVALPMAPAVDLQAEAADRRHFDEDLTPATAEEPVVVTIPVADDPAPFEALPVRPAPPARTPPADPPRVPQPAVRAAAVVDAAADAPLRGDIPDELVALLPRREAVMASPLPRASGLLLIRPPVVSPGATVSPDPALVSAAAAPPAVVAPVRQDETHVASVLDRYAQAFDALDARAARAVWPSVDERALARAFAGLESQHVSFDDCSIDVRGEFANASCRGRASYVGKIGSRQPRTEPRQWRFELRRDGEAWKIESALAVRQ